MKKSITLKKCLLRPRAQSWWNCKVMYCCEMMGCKLGDLLRIFVASCKT
jgi:hypothetical protein